MIAVVFAFLVLGLVLMGIGWFTDGPGSGKAIIVGPFQSWWVRGSFTSLAAAWIVLIPLAVI